MIRLRKKLLDDTFEIFRSCGRGRCECVAYWLGPLGVPDVVDEVVHPHHTATGYRYEIEDKWLTVFWFDLARRHRTVRVQVHTHSGRAFHSSTDDDWALVHTSGFLSLVIPNSAKGAPGFKDAFLAERIVGGWRAIPVGSRLELINEHA